MKLKPKIEEKRWDVKIESELIKRWAKEKIYKFDLKTKKKIFSIDTPPPYPKSV